MIFPEDRGIYVEKMPTLEAGKRTFIDDLILRDILRRGFEKGSSMHAVIEMGQLQPKWGVKGNYSSGYTFGVVATTLRQNAIPFTAISAKDWQKEMLLGVRSAQQDTKTAAIEACRRIFPDVSLLPTPRCSKPDDGMADALLMAEWARRHNL